MDRILELLQKDAKLSAARIAVMLGMEEAAVAAKIKEYEENGTILAYRAILNDEKDRKSTRLNSSHSGQSRMPSSA